MTDARGREPRFAPDPAATVPTLVRTLVARGGRAASATDARPLRPVHEVVDPGALAPGQLVTLLAPVAETLALTHACGWAHGAIGWSAIRLDERRAPVLVQWESAHTVDRAARGRCGPQRRRARRRDPRRDDLERLSDLCRAALISSGVAENDIEPVIAASLEGEPGIDGSGALALAERLYQFARPLPLAPMDPPRGTPVLHDGGVRSRAPVAAHAPRGLRAALRRRTFLAAATVIAMASLAAIAAGEMHAGGSSTQADAGGQEDRAGHDEGVDDDPAEETGETGVGVSNGDPSDPLTGALALLEQRNACITENNPACISTLYAPTSPGLDIELAALEHPGGGDLIAVASCVLAEHTGHAARMTCLAEVSGASEDPVDDHAGVQSPVPMLTVTLLWSPQGWQLHEVRRGGDA